MTDTRGLCPSVEKCIPTGVFVLFLIENQWPFILSRRLQPVSPTYTASQPGFPQLIKYTTELEVHVKCPQTL